MTAYRSPEEVVLALVRVINGDLPRHAASDYLDPNVRIHMDGADHRGITTWYKWIHLIRHRGRLGNLRMCPTAISSDPLIPGMVLLSIRWAGTDRSSAQSIVTPNTYNLQYLVRKSHIIEIWTHKINYVAIFGSWFRRSIYYRFFLGWSILYFVCLSLRGLDYRAD